MPASEARIAANRRNAQLSTGPKTEEGKARSRANAYKHGMAGDGVVMPEADAAEVMRRAVAFAAETDASGEIGMALARRAALNSVRMERAADQQVAALAEHVREVDAAFVPPEGVDAAEAARLRLEACRRAMFDPSPRAVLARKYEAAAERSFLRCVRELQQRDRDARAEARADARMTAEARMASFGQMERKYRKLDDEFDALGEGLDLTGDGPPPPPPRRAGHSPQFAPSATAQGGP